jgi:hypothetical protein
MSESKQGRSTAAKVLMPVAATVASAVASYLAKKGPQYLEQTVMPKLRDTKQSTGDVAGDLVERARSAVPGRDDGEGRDDEGRDGSRRRSPDELARRRKERAEHRAARRKAS